MKVSAVDDARERVEARIKRLTAGGKENVHQLRRRMAQVLWDKVGIFRTDAELQEAMSELQEVYHRAQSLGVGSPCGHGMNPELCAALRLPGMIRLALTMAYGALQRTESRGAHYREDYTKRDDQNWLKRTLATWPRGASLPVLSYELVRVTELPPGERGYGEGRAQKEVSHA